MIQTTLEQQQFIRMNHSECVLALQTAVHASMVLLTTMSLFVVRTVNKIESVFFFLEGNHIVSRKRIGLILLQFASICIAVALDWSKFISMMVC